MLLLILTLTTTSCSTVNSKVAFVERLDNWSKTLNIITQAIRVKDYHNTDYSKKQVEKDLLQLEPYLIRVDSEIKSATPNSGLEDVYKGLVDISNMVLNYVDTLLELCGDTGEAPLYHQKTPGEPYSAAVESIFTEYDRLLRDIREYKDLISELKPSLIS